MNKKTNRQDADLAFADTSRTMTAVTVHTDIIRHRLAVRTRDKRTLVLRAALLAAFVECIAVEFRQTVAWNS